MGSRGTESLTNYEPGSRTAFPRLPESGKHCTHQIDHLRRQVADRIDSAAQKASGIKPKESRF